MEAVTNDLPAKGGKRNFYDEMWTQGKLEKYIDYK